MKVLVLIFIVLAIVVGPLLLIWSLNTLFTLGIEYSITTWAAALVLGGVVSAKSSK
jgi:hypothetical protein